MRTPAHSLGRIGLAVAVALAVSAPLLAGCAPEDAAPPAPSPTDPQVAPPEEPQVPLSGEMNSIGDTVRVGDWELVVTEAEDVDEADERAPQEGGQLLRIELQLTNRGGSGATAETDEFVLLDAVGGAYLPVPNDERLIGPESWEAGETEDAELYFEIAPDATDLVLEFRPRAGGMAAVFIR